MPVFGEAVAGRTAKSLTVPSPEPMRTPLIVGNWKMNKTPSESEGFARRLAASLSVPPDREAAVAPSFPSLHPVSQALRGSIVGLAAQNCHERSQGAFTGEVSPVMLADVGCRYVIVGHSERRNLFGETDRTVKGKLAAVLAAGLTPILCVGETLEDREKDRTLRVVQGQVEACLSPLTEEELGRVVIAYEPVWAIGTGRTATPEQAQAVHAFIREIVHRLSNAVSRG